MCDCEKNKGLKDLKKIAKIQYVNDIYGLDKYRRGVMVAFPVDSDRVAVGYSLCNFEKGDEFDKDLGFAMAVDRAYAWYNRRKVKKIVNLDKYELSSFIRRISKYYKDKQLPEWCSSF